VERGDRAALATFFVDEPLAAGSLVSLDEGAARHARVRRVAVGDAVRLTNGRGRLAAGDVAAVTRTEVRVAVAEPRDVPRPPTLRLFVPVADRERMLWLAEKCGELAVSAWQPVVFRRSLSVSPRGEGAAFQRKVRARLIAALEQSGGAWLTDVGDERTLDDALALETGGVEVRYLLDRDGVPLIGERGARGADLLLGPEGGLEAAETSVILERGGFTPVSLGATTLRFETAGVVAAGILRARMERG
jgi:16S rRNA (uracil1498-N3)-methyltransferase